MPKSKPPAPRSSAKERQEKRLADTQARKLDKQKDDPNTMKDAGALTGYSIGAAGVANLTAKEWGEDTGSSIVNAMQYAGISSSIIMACIFMVLNFVAAWRLIKAYRNGSKDKKISLATLILILFAITLFWLELRAIQLIIDLP